MMHLPNMLMICGTGKNVGKTTLSVKIIEKLVSENYKVIAIKTSSHLHPLDKDEEIMEEGEEYAIVRERRNNRKDSAQMLQAGAYASYYIQAKKHLLFECIQKVWQEISTDSIIVCESGSLRAHIEPGVFLFLTGNGQRKNEEYEAFADRTLIWDGAGNHYDFDAESILVSRDGIALKA